MIDWRWGGGALKYLFTERVASKDFNNGLGHKIRSGTNGGDS